MNQTEMTVRTEEEPFTKGQRILAALLFFSGYLFIKWSCGNLSFFLFSVYFAAVSLFTLLAVYLPEKRRPAPLTVGGLVLGFLLSFVYLFHTDGTICLLTCLFQIGLYLFWFLHALAYRDVKQTEDGILLDGIKAFFVLPFGSFFSLFSALRPTPGRKHGWKKPLLCIFCGLILTITPTVLVIELLADGDPAFKAFLSSLTAVFDGEIFGRIFFEILLFLLGLPISCYICGSAHGGWKRKSSTLLGQKEKAALCDGAAKLPPLLLCSAAVPLCLVYLAFFFSQLGYYFDAFSGMIPDGFTVAEYAKSGFFQLCAVAMIDLAAILFLSVLSARSKKDPGKPAASTRFVCGILAVFTLLLILTALRKMILYIEIFGFTRLRVMTSWFMIFLFIGFIFLVIKQFSPGFKAWRTAAVVGCLMFAVLALSPLDTLIVKGNVLLYQRGVTESCDISSFYDLSPEACIGALPLLEDENKALADSTLSSLRCVADDIRNGRYTEDGWHDICVPLTRTASKLSEVLGEPVKIPAKGSAS